MFDTLRINDRAVGAMALSIAQNKITFSVSEALFRGILCNSG